PRRAQDGGLVLLRCGKDTHRAAAPRDPGGDLLGDQLGEVLTAAGSIPVQQVGAKAEHLLQVGQPDCEVGGILLAQAASDCAGLRVQAAAGELVRTGQTQLSGAAAEPAQ